MAMNHFWQISRLIFSVQCDCVLKKASFFCIPLFKPLSKRSLYCGLFMNNCSPTEMFNKLLYRDIWLLFLSIPYEFYTKICLVFYTTLNVRPLVFLHFGIPCVIDQMTIKTSQICLCNTKYLSSLSHSFIHLRAEKTYTNVPLLCNIKKHEDKRNGQSGRVHRKFLSFFCSVLTCSMNNI